MAFISTVRNELEALTQAVLDSLDADSQPEMAGFFSSIMACILRIEDEVDLANLFFELSTTAFRGFTFTGHQSKLVDRLLSCAENIANTMTAPSDRMH